MFLYVSTHLICAQQHTRYVHLYQNDATVHVMYGIIIQIILMSYIGGVSQTDWLTIMYKIIHYLK